MNTQVKPSNTPAPAASNVAAAVASTVGSAEPAAIAAASAAKQKRTQAFSRNFADFAGPLVLTPEGDVAKAGVKPVSYNAAEIAGFSVMPKGARIIALRGIADQLTQTFAAVLRGTKEEGEGSIEEALDEMRDVFASIVEGTFTYGRSGSGAGKVQGVALTAALMVAVQYGLADRAAAMAHADYAAIKEALAGFLLKADDESTKAEAIVIPEATKGNKVEEEATAAAELVRDTHEANATALRSSYLQLAKDEKVSALRAKWYPPKAKTATAPTVTVAGLFAGIKKGATPAPTAGNDTTAAARRT